MKIKSGVLFSILLILIIMNGCTNSETITGYWTGSMEMNGKTVDMSIDISQDKNMFSSYDLMLPDQPVSNLKFINGEISFSVNADSDGYIAAESHREIEKMIRKGIDYKDVEKFIHQNAETYGFMNQTGLYGNLSIDKNEFSGFYWKDLNIPTLVLYGERDDLINAEKSEAIIKGLKNDNIVVKLFPRANHHLKKSFNPTIDNEFDWPRLTEGYSEIVKNWIRKEIE